ncbi:MAG: cysteine synthase A, partial [Paludibacteraceae bacterium]
MNIADSIISTIGHTPLVEIRGLENQKARLVVKIESFNPGGSIKDRTALAMIQDAERSGLLRAGASIIEPTSGNTGVGLAWIGAIKGYRVVLTMPETMSAERRALLRAYGAELVLTPGAKVMDGAIRRAEELQQEIPNAVILGQFTNPANPRVHELTTGEEIWEDTDGEVAAVVAGVGTGGTLTGVARALRKHRADIYTLAVEPSSSPVLSGGQKGTHKIQGIGAGFVPDNFDPAVVDAVCTVTDKEAFAAARLLACRYGILCGISSGAAFAAAARLATKEEWRGKMIVTILPDTGERYLSL